MSKEKIVLIGGGGHCKSVIDVIEQTNKYEIIGIVDVNENVGKTILGYSIIGTDNDLESIFLSCKNACITVGHIKSNTVRKKLYALAKKIGFHLPTIISPLAYVSKHTKIGESNVIMHQTLINANATIGDNNIINSKSLIEHDVTINNHCHISTGAIINGGVIVEEDSFIGSNATIKEYSEVGGFIKANSLSK